MSEEAVGVKLHALGTAELPTGVVGERVPVALPMAGIEVGSAPNGSGAVAVAVPEIGACDETQVTLVPGVVGSSASATGASVVSGALETVAAENGLGPVRGDDTMAPGVDGIPMAVVPVVETCARQALLPSSPVIRAMMKSLRIAVDSTFGACPCRRTG